MCVSGTIPSALILTTLGGRVFVFLLCFILQMRKSSQRQIKNG